MEFSWQKPQVLSHRRANSHVGQKSLSQSFCTQVQQDRQSSSFGHVVTVLERVVEVLCVEPVCVVRVCVVVVRVPELTEVLDTVEVLVSVPLVSVVDVIVVVCVRDECVTVSVVVDRVEEDVLVKVVQKLHVLSHNPAYWPHVSQNRVWQGSSQGWLKFWQVRLQNQSGFRFTCRHGVLVSVLAVVVGVEAVVVEMELVDDAEVVEAEVVVVGDVVVGEVLVSVDVAEVVVLTAQTPHVVSHMCAPTHVGQNTVSQPQPSKWPSMH